MKPLTRTLLPLPMRRSWQTTIFRPINTASSQYSQIFRLPDGRALGYADYGSPTGYPVIYFHGYPSSRLEGFMFDLHGTLHRNQIRLIAPDRPGFGLSTVKPDRRIMDWPADVKVLAQHLGLSRFAVLGCSGGSPYALACAHGLPHELMSAVGILAGAGPPQAGRHQMPYLYQASGVLAERWPAGLRTILSLVAGTLQKAANTRTATRWLDDYWGKSFPEKPQNLAVEELRAILLRMLFDGFAQGAQPAVQEARLLSQDWGIPFEEVTYDKIQVWHGARDKNAPLQMMQWMTDRLPHSVLKVYENDTHFTMDQHLEAVLLALVPEKTKG